MLMIVKVGEDEDGGQIEKEGTFWPCCIVLDQLGVPRPDLGIRVAHACLAFLNRHSCRREGVSRRYQSQRDRAGLSSYSYSWYMMMREEEGAKDEVTRLGKVCLSVSLSRLPSSRFGSELATFHLATEYMACNSHSLCCTNNIIKSKHTYGLQHESPCPALPFTLRISANKAHMPRLGECHRDKLSRAALPILTPLSPLWK
jgi:hypothetical protein